MFTVLSKNKLNPKDKEKNYSGFFIKHKNNVDAYSHYIRYEYFDDNFQDVIRLADEYLLKFPNNEDILLTRVDALVQLGLTKEAIHQIIGQIKVTKTTDKLLLKLIEIIEKTDDQETLKNLLHYSFIKFPNSENIVLKYYKYLDEKGENEKCLFLIDRLNSINVSAYYSCLKGNVLLNLKFNNASMDCYMKVLELSERKESWILSNIGNLFRNQSFYSEAIKYLEEAKALTELSDYTLDRLAHSVRSKKEETDNIETIIKNSRQSIFNLQDFDENLLEKL